LSVKKQEKNMFNERWQMPMPSNYHHFDHRRFHEDDEEGQQRQNKCRRYIYRKHSDPVKLKAAHDHFVRHWNGESTPPRVNPVCVIRARSAAATDFEEVRHVNWAFNSPRRTRLNQLLIDPELCKLRQKYERRVERRRSLSVANHSLYAEKANPKKSAIIDKYFRVLPFGRRSLSLGTLFVMSEHEIDVDLFGVKQSKRVSFSAPTAKRKSVCPETNKPAVPILLKEPKKSIDSDYPLSHMDYATFKAWRNGETFRQSVDSTETESEEEKTPQESMVQFLKLVIFSCLRR
jgi:hypothetical protein